uniref:Uncharacterized protein n=1 Tax=Oryza brachyantha TaxID=4533 RepID=J3L145_ORYBR
MTLEASVEATLGARRGDPWTAAQRFTIFRVPAYVRESSRASYEPRVVSVGPYYHSAPALRALENHKWRCLDDVLSRRAAGAVTASELVTVVRPLEDQARACYGERPVGMGSDDFLRMLLLDGCFILEFFFKLHANKEPDALYDVGWGITLVAADLLLMENQILFFVLERLYAAVAGVQGTRESLLHLFIEYVGSDDEKPMRWPSGDWKVDHLLHVYYQSFVPNRTPLQRRTPSPTTTRAPRVIPCATEMSDAGVKFVVARGDTTAARAARRPGSPPPRRGVMEIPTILIDDARRPLLANLIALEQSQGGEEAGLLSSYVALMSQLIATARDVELLRRRGVVESLLDNDEEAAGFFNRAPRRRQPGGLRHAGLRRTVRGRGALLPDVAAQANGGAPAQLFCQPVVGHLRRRRSLRRRSRHRADVLHRVSTEQMIAGLITRSLSSLSAINLKAESMFVLNLESMHVPLLAPAVSAAAGRGSSGPQTVPRSEPGRGCSGAPPTVVPLLPLLSK